MPIGMYWAYPNQPVNMGDVNINFSIERDVHKYSYRDDLRFWQGFKFTIQTIEGQEYICTPVENAWSPTAIANFTKTTMNLASGKIHLQRPVNKKAYLHGISYAIYDYHQLVPRFLPPELCPSSGQFYDAYYNDTNETLFSVIVGKLGYPNEDPDFNYIKYLNDGIKYATFDYALPFMNQHRYRDFHTLQMLNYTKNTAPRSNVLYGMLPMDYYHNHFDMTLIGYDINGNVVKNIWDNKKEPNSGVISKHSFEILHEEIVPQIFNDINLLIDDNITDVELVVYRPYFWISLQPNSTYNPLNGTELPMGNQTIFRLPVKVETSILYY
jgi:hypothetical protein